MNSLEEFYISPESQDSHYLTKALEKGLSFQEILGFSAQTMVKFYGAAYTLFQQHKYREAADAFVFLTTLNPRVHEYWLGLGMAEQFNQEYETALTAYSMAAITHAENPWPHYHSATCYQKLSDPANARYALELALLTAGDNAEYAFLKSQILANF